MKCRTYRSPLNTSYAWDISHALATLYHPYAHDPSALTEYLKRKLQVQHAKRQSRSHPTQVEPNVPLEHNIDGTINQGGTISQYCNLWVRRGKHVEKLGFYVANLGRDRLILGYPWFTKFNPNFDWKNNVLEGEEVEIDTAGYRRKIITTLRTTDLTRESEETEKKVILNQIPAAYHQYWEVFSEQASYRFPPEREEDHAIILKEGAPDKIDCKIY